MLKKRIVIKSNIGGVSYDFEDCVKFCHQESCGLLATVDGDQPGYAPWDCGSPIKAGFTSRSPGIKDIYKQLQANPKVEFAFTRLAHGRTI